MIKVIETASNSDAIIVREVLVKVMKMEQKRLVGVDNLVLLQLLD
jgi:hypothetical protein